MSAPDGPPERGSEKLGRWFVILVVSVLGFTFACSRGEPQSGGPAVTTGASAATSASAATVLQRPPHLTAPPTPPRFGPARVLVVTPDAARIGRFREALIKAGLSLEVRPPKAFPETLSDIDRFDMIVLANVPGGVLDAKSAAVTEIYLRERGGSLLVACGEETRDDGPWKDPQWSALLPVALVGEHQGRAVEISLLIDDSASMDGDRMAAAKAGGKAVTAALGPTDRVEIITLSEPPQRLLEMQVLGDGKRAGAAFDALETKNTDASPALVAALELAHAGQASGRRVASRRHVVVITDGTASDGGLREQVDAMVADGITVSAVGLGSEAGTGPLRTVAEYGGGRYFAVTSARELTMVLGKEAELILARASDDLLLEVGKGAGSQLFKHTAIGGAPFLRGAVPAILEPPPAEALVGGGGGPILARWKVGDGSALVWTSQIHEGNWNRDFLEWAGWDGFWKTIVAHHVRGAKAVAPRQPLPAGARLRVLAVTNGNPFLRAALLDEVVDVVVAAPAHYPTAGDGFDVTIFDGVAPTPVASSGGVIYIDPSGPESPVSVRGFTSSIDLGFEDRLPSSPMFDGVPPLSGVNILRARRLEPDPTDVVLARSAFGPLIVQGRRAGRPFVVLAFKLQESDLPLRASWPILLVNVMEQLAGRSVGHVPPGDLPAPQPSSAATSPATPRPTVARVLEPPGGNVFAGAAYEKVYRDYLAVARRDLADGDALSISQRRYAARYFQAIRPTK